MHFSLTGLTDLNKTKMYAGWSLTTSKYGLRDHIQLIQLPVNTRYKLGKKDQASILIVASNEQLESDIYCEKGELQ